MPTHTDNRHYGSFIEDLTIQGDVNNVEGVNQAALLAFIPVDHDVSDQADGVEKEFTLDPAIATGTENWVSVYVNGQLMARGPDSNTDKDYYIAQTRNKIVLTDTFGSAPDAGSVIIVRYVEANGL